jgi:hypothetical protein
MLFLLGSVLQFIFLYEYLFIDNTSSTFVMIAKFLSNPKDLYQKDFGILMIRVFTKNLPVHTNFYSIKLNQFIRKQGDIPAILSIVNNCSFIITNLGSLFFLAIDVNSNKYEFNKNKQTESHPLIFMYYSVLTHINKEKY